MATSLDMLINTSYNPSGIKKAMAGVAKLKKFVVGSAEALKQGFADPKKDIANKRKGFEDIGANANIEALNKHAMVATKSIKSMGSQVKKATVGARKFKMEYLSTMFMGMQIYKLASSTIKSLIDTFRKLDEKGTRPITKSLNRLEASFTFLKFSIMEAMGPWIEKFSIWFADLAITLSDHPELLEQFGKSLIRALKLGGLMYANSQLALFLNGLKMMLAPGGVLEGLVKYGPLLGKLFGALAIGWSVKNIWDALTTEGVNWKEIISAGLGLGVSAGMITGSLATGFTVGIITLTVLTAIELALNPSDGGKYLARASNWLLGIFEKVYLLIQKSFDVIADLLQNGWKAIFDPDYSMKDAFNDALEGMKSYINSFGDSFDEELLRLKQEGKLTFTMEAARGSDFFEQNMPKGVLDSDDLQKARDHYAGIQDNTFGVSKNLMSIGTHLGGPESGVIFQTTQLNSEFSKVTETINTATDAWEGWTPPSKNATINVTYQYSGGPEGPSNFSSFDNYTSGGSTEH
jgi:hypothetical protein